MDKLKIYSSSGTFIRNIDSVISCSFHDSLTGECSLEFSLLFSDCGDILGDILILFGSLYFRVSGVRRSLSDGLYICTYTCEHESMSLSDDEVEAFSYSGSASGALREILSGTSISAGNVPLTNVEIDETNTNRRRLLYILAEKLGYEVEFSFHQVNIIPHRGRTAVHEISRYADLTETMEGITGNASYELTLPVGDYEIGDEVRILCPALGIDARRRFIELSYEPYNADVINVTVGDSIPEITDSIGDVRSDVDDLRKNTEEALTDTVKKSDLSASIDTYINSEEGKASIVLSLAGTYVTEDVLSGYTKKVELSAEIGAYIDTHEGTAKIINALSGTYVTSDELGDYVEKTELQTEIGSYIDTQAGTAKIISACSGTYQTKAGMTDYVTTTSLSSSIEQYIDSKAGTAKLISAVSGTYQTKAGMTDYVKTTELNTTVAQYIDSKAGTAKIVSACSGTYQTISGMSDYAKVSAVTSIEQSVSDVEASITLSSSYSKNTIGTNVYALLQLVSNANSSSIKLKADKIDFTGFTTFLRASDLGSSGKTTIDGGRITTGTISADRIDVSKLKVNTIYGSDSYTSTALMYSDSNKLYLGGTSITGSKVSEVNIYSTSSITILSKNVKIGSTYALEIYVDTSSGYLRPSTNDTFTLGSSTYRFAEIFTKKATIGATSYYISIDEKCNIIPSTKSFSSGYGGIGSSSNPFGSLHVQEINCSGNVNFTNTTLKISAGSTSYFMSITANQIVSQTTATRYLGTDKYYWNYAYIGSSAAYIGNSSSSKLGFFGTTPVARQTVSSSATVSALITALKAYGLIG